MSVCQRCGREQPTLYSPCPKCDAGIGGYTLHTVLDGERPLRIIDPGGIPLFSFQLKDQDLASNILHNLNHPASEWEAA